VAGGRGLELRVAAMPEGEDPADMLQEGALDRFNKLVEGAIDLVRFQVGTILKRADLGDPTGRDRALTEIAPHIKAMGERVGKDELIREIADRLDTDPSLVTERVRSAPELSDAGGAGGPGGTGGSGASGGGSGNGRSGPRPALTPRETRERALLAMCIADPKRGAKLIERLREEHMSASGAPALAWLRDHLEDPLSGLPRDDEALVSLITELKMRAERDPSSQGAMDLNFMLLEQQRLEDGISAAQRAGDQEGRARLLRERAQLTDRIAHAEPLGA
jgi:DNA primase